MGGSLNKRLSFTYYDYEMCCFKREMIALKAWRNWTTLLAKHYCFRLKSGITFLSIANNSETNNSVCQAMLASFAKALRGS